MTRLENVQGYDHFVKAVLIVFCYVTLKNILMSGPHGNQIFFNV